MAYSEWVLTFLLAWPLLAGVGILLAPAPQAKHFALAATLVEVAAALPMWWLFDPAAATQFGLDLAWITGWGVRYTVGADGFSLVLVLLTVVLMPLTVLGSYRYITKHE